MRTAIEEDPLAEEKTKAPRPGKGLNKAGVSNAFRKIGEAAALGLEQHRLDAHRREQTLKRLVSLCHIYGFSDMLRRMVVPENDKQFFKAIGVLRDRKGKG
jgi:hypothetical protein